MIYKGVSVVRCEHKSGGAGYQVRRGSGGPGDSKYFSDSKHGGKRKALRAARALADEWLAGVVPIAERLNARNTSTVPAVRFAWKQGTAHQYLYCLGGYTDKHGQRRTVGYSCDKHGPEKAIRLALACRKLSPEFTEDAVKKLLRKYRELVKVTQ